MTSPGEQLSLGFSASKRISHLTTSRSVLLRFNIFLLSFRNRAATNSIPQIAGPKSTSCKAFALLDSSNLFLADSAHPQQRQLAEAGQFFCQYILQERIRAGVGMKRNARVRKARAGNEGKARRKKCKHETCFTDLGAEAQVEFQSK